MKGVIKLDISKLPKALKDLKAFCLYRLEPGKNPNKPDKVPYQPNGARASPNKPETFTDFKSVYAVFLQGGYDGIGFRVPETMEVVDIDDCIVDGKLTPFAQEIVDKIDSYTEISPSETGIHILAYTNAPQIDTNTYYLKNSKIGLEMYPGGTTDRYMTLTLNVHREKDVEGRTEELDEVRATYMVKPVAKKLKVEPPGSYLTDESVMEKMFSSANAEKVRELWNGGNADKPSASEADAALCMILAFYCGGDMEQIQRIFLKSGRVREKWDSRRGGETYGEMTIRNAVENCTEFYKPLGLSTPQEDFGDLAIKLESMVPDKELRYRNGDLGNGRLFADFYKDIARYVPERKMWFIYDGIRWVADQGALMTMELAKDLGLALTRYATAIKDESVREHWLKEWSKWHQRRFRETYIKEAQSVFPVYMEQFDKDIYLFNCRNGTLNLRDKIFREHRAEDFITKVSMVDFEPDANNLRFTQFVDEITSKDTEKAVYLQKALGYAISGDTRHECMFFLYGETTRNGKGTLMESVLSVMGDYGRAVRPETIAQKQSANSSNPTEDIARLAGIRFANISEPSRGLFLNAAQVKSMTGNDTLNARFLHENSFDFKPQFKLYVNTNYLPVISDMTVFSSNRVHIIPFDRHFEEWEQDKTLKQEFATDEAKSAILNWLVEGYYLLEKDGLKPPQSVVDATNSYAHDSDKITQFAEDVLIVDGACEVRTAIVYERYKRWCSDNGCFFENSRNFNQELRKFGRVERKRPQGGGEKTTMLIGFRLKDVITDFLGGN